MTTIRTIGALGSVAVIGAIGFAIPASAHDPEKGERVERIIIFDKEAAAAKDAKGPLRRLDVVRLHPDRPGRCGGDATQVDAASGEKERTRIVLCSDGKGSAEERVKRLEEMLGRIRSDDRMSAEHRAKVETALQDAIAKLRDAE